MRLYKFLQDGWVDSVDTKWHPEPGFFKHSAEEIAKGLKTTSKDLQQAMARLNFYINRAGDKLKNPAKFERAKKILHGLFSSESS